MEERPCDRCGKPSRYVSSVGGIARACGNCRATWRRRGRPVLMEPAPSFTRDREGHMEDFLFLRPLGLSNPQMAKRLGVSERTVTRYRRAAREAAGQAA